LRFRRIFRGGMRFATEFGGRREKFRAFSI
jgi:hypothetical protein